MVTFFFFFDTFRLLGKPSSISGLWTWNEAIYLASYKDFLPQLSLGKEAICFSPATECEI